ncbi:unnamed protein product [Enterobius vermicularis]|uniref:Protein-serine/threonine phosphatase n=1 Tax=Enterobius vermicularis TaxID=51028 RepID=A0A0N4VMJ8_ENTVE|nr:unnamed protein product [Enterobius vermicularis]
MIEKGVKDRKDLSNDLNYNELLRGCDLLSEYRTCTETLNVTDCDVSSQLKGWTIVELYLCQLLLPSVKEHQKCFALAGDPRCSTGQ